MARKDKTKNISLSGDHDKPKLLIPPVSSKNEGQKSALREIANPENYIIMLSGIAGVGKSYIAASWGIEQLLKNKFQRIILTRPCVEAGESLGFLPGSFAEKLNPYLLPILDILHEHLTNEQIKTLMDEQKIVTLPLAFMRGVTFKNAFVLLDEAQNTTVKQMHLFLTRIGMNSKVVITGDPSQSDLGDYNGFSDALERFGEPLEGLKIVNLDSKCVVRHGIIPFIDERYKAKRN